MMHIDIDDRDYLKLVEETLGQLTMSQHPGESTPSTVYETPISKAE